MKVAIFQVETRDDETTAERVKRVCDRIDELPPFDLLLLPEIWNVGYFSFDRYVQDSEKLDGPTVTALSDLARRRGAYIFGGSIVEKDGDDCYNTSVLLDAQGNLAASYRKIHLFGYGSKEQQVLTAGKEPVVADTPWGRMGISTCYDLRFPELYRAMVDDGSRMFLVASGWPYPRLEHWEILARARAIENQSFMLACNGCGVTQGSQLLGHSAAIDPWGVPLAAAGDEEIVLQLEIDPDQVERVRKRFPALADRAFNLTVSPR